MDAPEDLFLEVELRDGFVRGGEVEAGQRGGVGLGLPLLPHRLLQYLLPPFVMIFF